MSLIGAIGILAAMVCMVLPAADTRRPTDEAPQPAPPSEAWRQAKRVVVFVVGGTVVLVGLVLTVLPGPAFIVIPAGLAILATEFVWARRLLRNAKRSGGKLGRWVTGKKSRRAREQGSSGVGEQESVGDRGR